jgi:predicted nucleic acid-binding protein
VNEVGSERVGEILLAASSLGLSVICLSEVVSGLCRLRREGKLSPPQYVENKRALISDVEASVVINITDRVVARAVKVLERWPLRSSDALHVACAAEWAADMFVSADERQCQAARGYGLRVEALGAG